MAPRVHRIVLELDAGAEPVSGRVCVAGAEPRPFLGWTALISTVLAATASDPADPVASDQARAP